MINFSKALNSPSSKGKSLTGIPLNVRDLVIEVHSNIQRWNTAHLKGVPVVQSIIDLKVDASYPEELTGLCSLLEKVCEAIVGVRIFFILMHPFE